MGQATSFRFFSLPPSLEDMEKMAYEALVTIPPELRRFTNDLVIRLEDFPDEDVMEAMELDSPFDLLGLYEGVNMLDNMPSAQATDLNRIYLYRRPILDFWVETGDDLKRILRHVLIHEIGHHFGFSDDDMEYLEQEV
jgi:predicted Zn-dependent protease with MMP-like domain